MGGLVHLVQVFLAEYGLVALFVLLTLEEAGVWLPLPGDLLIIYFGAQLPHARNPLLAAVPVLLTVTIAVLAGSVVLYLVVRRFRWILRRIGPFLRLDERRLAWMESRLQRHGAAVVIPGRLVPGLRIPTTVVCGAFGVPLPLFVPAAAVAALIWGVINLAVGAAGRSILHLAHGLLPDAPLEWLLWLLAIGGLTAITLLARQLFTRAGSRS